AAVQLFFDAFLAGIDFFAVDRRPARIARDALFVTNPADVWPRVAEDDGVRLQLSHQRPRRRPIVIAGLVNLAPFARTAVIAVAAVRAVVPDFKQLAVPSQQFAQLFA